MRSNANLAAAALSPHEGLNHPSDADVRDIAANVSKRQCDLFCVYAARRKR